MGKDYIPSNDAEFDRFFKFMIHYVDARCEGTNPEWTHIPPEARQKMHGACAVWDAAYIPTLAPHSPVETAAKNKAKKDGKAVIRPFVNQYLRFPPVTDEDRRAMGVPVKDTQPTPVPEPEDIPEVDASTPVPRRLRFRFRKRGAKYWGKPEGVHGLECLWVVSDTPPKKLEDLVHSSFATKSPLELTFDEDDRGKRLYYAVRWETGTVKKGPWSDIFSVVIP